MCRLFAFKSIIQSHVHSTLLGAENTLYDLSTKHPDGWGIAYYVENTPHLIKSTTCAMEDQIFQKISRSVSTQNILAHIRKATLGENSLLNSHPFQYGHWTFAHNGNIKNFKAVKPKLLNLIDPSLQKHILGTTDSEIIFTIILTEIQKDYPLNQLEIPTKGLALALERALKKIIEIIGPLSHNQEPVPEENYLTIILNSGSNILAINGGQDLWYCTHKTQCPERDSCTAYADICEKKASQGSKINHLILSSEKIPGANVWNIINPGEIVGIDQSMIFFKDKLEIF